jgi:hypothetical protein
MFPYWSAPPSLLRIWACPDEPSPAIDSRFRFRSPDLRARGEWMAHLVSRIGCHLRSLRFSRPANRQLPAC